MARKSKTGDNTGELAKNTARRLFSSAGVRAVSLADIASAANISKGTLYYYYPAKEDLVAEIAEEHFASVSERLFAWLNSLSENTADHEMLLSLCEYLFPGSEGAKLHFVLLNEIMYGNEPLREIYERRYREWKVVIEMGILRTRASSELRDNSALLLSLIDGAALHALIGREVDFSALSDFVRGKLPS